MVDGQSGEMIASDSDGGSISQTIFDINGQSTGIDSSKDVIIIFEEPQNVTTIEFPVSSDVLVVTVEYRDENYDLLVSHHTSRLA